MPNAKRKTDSDSRIHCRISPSLKSKVESAAKLCGQSITAFTEVALAEKARDVLQQEERIQLSQSTFQAFLEILEVPPSPPSSKLLDAVEDYKRHRSS